MGPEGEGALYNQTVLVTRPAMVAGPLIECLEAAGARVIHWPALEFSVAEPSKHEWLRTQLLQSQRLIFSSQPAVDSALEIMGGTTFPTATKIFAVGATTASRLEMAGYEVVFPTDGNGSEALLGLPEFQSVAGMSIGVVCAPGGRQLLFKELTARGAKIGALETYQTHPTAPSPGVLETLEAELDALWVTATSGQILTQLSEVLAPKLRGNLLARPTLVPAPRLRHVAERLGFQHIMVSSGPQPEAMLAGLIGNKAT